MICIMDVMGPHINIANVYIYHVMGHAAGSAKICIMI